MRSIRAHPVLATLPVLDAGIMSAAGQKGLTQPAAPPTFTAVSASVRHT
jgi:hypothetical protein